ncbi:hypothetical protein NO2_0641 [Candidatus Termititenax persephonae]|uniref:Uncharacterized protein n=1 Tax=Candidatus Termititenax persephonae TaxID=2218525 RepID=A0A388TH66_9BACT|nr:hypothetical protein NO2_0641 [Candidatus Termititenax persephonae]
MNATTQILNLLENTKFSAENDLAVWQIGLDMIFKQSARLWEKGTKERQLLLDLLGGKIILSRPAWQKTKGLEPLVVFVQGSVLITLSLLNGIGRSPIAVQKTSSGYKMKILSKLQSIAITPGLFDAETEKLVQEFKHSFFGRALDADFGKNDLLIIKETLKETLARLKNEKAFMEKIADNPLQIFAPNISEENLSGGLFLAISALPAETMNALLMQIGSYLPGELEAKTENRLSVNVRTYFTTSTLDLPELFQKARLLLKLYSGKQRTIITIIVREKVRDFFQELLASTEVKQQVKNNLNATANEQFGLRIQILGGLLKLL